MTAAHPSRFVSGDRRHSFGRCFGFVLVLAASLGTTGCQFANSHNVSGVQLYQQGNLEYAAQQFQRALAADPRNADGYYNLGATYHQAGVKRKDQNLLAQAESAYQQCLRYDTNHVECRRGFAVLLMETQRRDEAFAMLRNWAESNPKSDEARVELARLAEESGDRKTAQRHLYDALALNPKNPRAWTALGKIREDAGDYQLAYNNYRQAFQSNRYQPGVYQRMAALSQHVQAPAQTNPNDTRMVDLPAGASFLR